MSTGAFNRCNTQHPTPQPNALNIQEGGGRGRGVETISLPSYRYGRDVESGGTMSSTEADERLMRRAIDESRLAVEEGGAMVMSRRQALLLVFVVLRYVMTSIISSIV